jgi:hypothetical protein
MATEDDNVSSGALGTLLAVGAFTTLGIMLVVTALVRSEMSEEAEKKEVGANSAFHDLANEQSAKLNAPAAYVDRGKGLVSLPIERAMELVVSGLTKDPNSATPPAAATGGSAGSGGADAATAGSGGSAGTGGAATTATEGELKPPDEATHGETDKPEGDKEKPAEKKDSEKKDKEKKEAPKPKPAPAAPAPAAPAPAPAPAAPAPAPHGQ